MEEAKLVWLCKQPVPDWCGLDGCVVDPAAEGYGDVVLGPGYGPYVGAVLEEACARGVQEACDALKRAEKAEAAFAVAQTGLPPPKPNAANTTEPAAGTQLQVPPRGGTQLLVPPRALGLPNGTLLSRGGDPTAGGPPQASDRELPQVIAPRSRLPEQLEEAEASTTRSARDLRHRSAELAADPSGWFYGPPSALYSNLGEWGAPAPASRRRLLAPLRCPLVRSVCPPGHCCRGEATRRRAAGPQPCLCHRHHLRRHRYHRRPRRHRPRRRRRPRRRCRPAPPPPAPPPPAPAAAPVPPRKLGLPPGSPSPRGGVNGGARCPDAPPCCRVRISPPRCRVDGSRRRSRGLL